MNKRITFPSNDKIRNKGAKIPLTAYQTQEFVKCKISFEYFCTKYIKIISLDDSLINFDMRPYQQELYKLMETERFIISKIPRQYGKTILVIAFFLWKVTFNKHLLIGIFADGNDTAIKILEKLQISYEELPLWMQQGVEEWRKGKIKLENGSVIVCGATTGRSGRSGSYNYILLDEFAFVQGNLQSEFYRAVYPTITGGKTTRLFIISTPNGMELFYKLWNQAIQGQNMFKAFEVKWDVLPGRDAKWKEQTISNMGEDLFNQEFGCEFLGSGGNTLIKPTKLMSMPVTTPIAKKQEDNQFLDIYVKPLDGHIYCLCADTSQGLGQDYSTFSVIDITSMPYIQVAKYRNNTISQTEFPFEIFKAGNMYNGAYVLIEINEGRQVAELLYSELEYENQMFVFRRHAGTGQRITMEYLKGANPGVIMSNAVKKVGTSNLKNLIEKDNLILNDYDTISELSSFIKSGPTYAAAANANDDMVMTLVVFSWLAIQPYFKELTSSNIREKIRQKKTEMIEEMTKDPIIQPSGNTKSTIDRDCKDDCVWNIPGKKDSLSVL